MRADGRERMLAVEDRTVTLAGTLPDPPTAGHAALARLPLPVLLLRSDGWVLYANPAAERALARGDGLAVIAGRLYAPKPADSRRLRTLAAEIAATGQPQVLVIDGSAGDAAAVLIAAPIAAHGATPPGLAPVAIATIADLRNPASLVAEPLLKLLEQAAGMREIRD